jgi:hypothetical protein
MARTFSGSQYLSKVITPYSISTVFTMAAWVNFASPLTDGVIMGAGGSTSAKTTYYQLAIISGKATFKTQINTNTAAATITPGLWYHIQGICVSTAARSVYLNGVIGTSAGSQGAATAADLDTLSIGNSIAAGVWQTAIKATIAFPAFWLASGATAQVLNPPLLAGAYPLLNNPTAIISCSDLIGTSPEPDRCSATPWTLTGASTLAPNPSIYR